MSPLAKGGLRNPITGAFFLDDWQDNKLTNRDAFGTTPLDYNRPGGPFSGFPSRPEYTTDNGTPKAQNQRLEILSSNNAARCRTGFNIDFTNFDSLIWEFDFYRVSNSGSNQCGCTLASKSTSSAEFGIYQDSYAVRLNDSANNGVYFVRYDGSSSNKLISSSAGNDQWVTVKVTRDEVGGWELFIDGSSVGTVTDTTYADVSYTGFGSTLDGDIYFDDYKLYG